MTGGLSLREVRAGYSELGLIERPAIDLLTSLGWTFRNLYAESFGELGSEGRESERQVILAPRLRAALIALNPGLPPDATSEFARVVKPNATGIPMEIETSGSIVSRASCRFPIDAFDHGLRQSFGVYQRMPAGQVSACRR